MSRLRSLLLVAAACALALAVPGSAVAAAIATPVAPLATGPLDAQIWPAQAGNTTVVIADVTLDPKVKLPVRVRIPVPKGSVVEWAGEILNGDANSDQQRTFSLHDALGGSYAEFTMSVSHRGQIETNGIVMTANGTKVLTQVDWVQSVPSTSTLFTVRIPAGTSSVTIQPTPDGVPETNAAGESLYVLPTQHLAPGSLTSIKVEYDTVPAAVASGGGGVNLTAVYLVLGVLLVGAVAVVIYLVGRQNAAAAQDEEEFSDEDDSDDDAFVDDSEDEEPQAADDSDSASDDHDEDDAFDIHFE